MEKKRQRLVDDFRKEKSKLQVVDKKVKEFNKVYSNVIGDDSQDNSARSSDAEYEVCRPLLSIYGTNLHNCFLG